jgi:squalene-hopene/tetraprenyl-beta-curcumene cyclase
MNDRALERTRIRLKQRLLDARQQKYYWTGGLSDSALSTATAVVALHLAGNNIPIVEAGMNWLERFQNEDGGFGDTSLSHSNLSTTLLCWAAFLITGRRSKAKDQIMKWIGRNAGGPEPDVLIQALTARYGNDRTFSVPILAVLAVAGIVPWRMVPQLPFELAACPRSWFSKLGLPVVSYALPALIAIGQVRHNRLPSKNPAVRLFRSLASDRTLRILENIQPANGGYLEAIPLTSFVCISLLAAGDRTSAALTRGLEFLRQTVRPCGSWPIDTNLAAWVTTLSVNALQNEVPASDRAHIAAWLVDQQLGSVHPYTGAAPGGWAWTNLPGGVPDADDTAGALVALHTLGLRNARILAAATAGVRWLLDLQNRDGGIPTFCRGWGKLPFDRSSCDITAHALQAWMVWKELLCSGDQKRVNFAIDRAIKFLEGAQRPDGAWTPLWFGNQLAQKEENPVYGTARVLLGVRRIHPESAVVCRAIGWLLAAQNEDGGWGGDSGLPASIEETALAVAALAGLSDEAARHAAIKGAQWIAHATSEGEETPPSPIGLYFARLWYFEALYPLIFALDALQRVDDQEK